MWYTILTIIVFIIIFILLHQRITTQEEFQCVFLDHTQTSNFLLQDNDQYIQSLSPLDLKARHTETHNEYLQLAAQSTLKFTQDQIDKLKNCSIQADKFFHKLPKNPYIHHGNKLVNIQWQFALVSDTYEEGLPHTRLNTIFLYPKIIEYPHTQLVKTLIHEKIHIYQRYNLQDIRKNLHNQGYIPHRLRHSIYNQRSNPDLDEFTYISPTGVEMIATYKDDHPQSLYDTNITERYEHPFEMICYEIQEMI